MKQMKNNAGVPEQVLENFRSLVTSRLRRAVKGASEADLRKWSVKEILDSLYDIS